VKEHAIKAKNDVNRVMSFRNELIGSPLPAAKNQDFRIYLGEADIMTDSGAYIKASRVCILMRTCFEIVREIVDLTEIIGHWSRGVLPTTFNTLLLYEQAKRSLSHILSIQLDHLSSLRSLMSTNSRSRSCTPFPHFPPTSPRPRQLPTRHASTVRLRKTAPNNHFPFAFQHAHRLLRAAALVRHKERAFTELVVAAQHAVVFHDDSESRVCRAGNAYVLGRRVKAHFAGRGFDGFGLVHFFPGVMVLEEAALGLRRRGRRRRIEA